MPESHWKNNDKARLDMRRASFQAGMTMNDTSAGINHDDHVTAFGWQDIPVMRGTFQFGFLGVEHNSVALDRLDELVQNPLRSLGDPAL